MKLKKILASLIAAAAVVSTVSLTGLAVNDGEATYCFDNDSRIADWETYGSVAETGFKITQSIKQSNNGEGSILISENVQGEVSNAYGGAFITASTVGLASFEKCTITMSVLLCEGA